MKNMKQWLSLVAALGLMVGVSSAFVSAQEKDAKPAGKGTVAGTVLDKDGKAVEGVEVHLMKPMMRRGGPGGPGGGQRPGGEGGARRPADQASKGGPAARQLQDAPPPPPPGAGRPGPEPVAKATTDKDGKFEMKDVPAGPYMVGVRDMDKKLFGRAQVTVEADKTATVEIKCSDTPPARGGGRGPGGPGGPGGRGPGQGGGAGQ